MIVKSSFGSRENYTARGPGDPGLHRTRHPDGKPTGLHRSCKSNHGLQTAALTASARRCRRLALLSMSRRVAHVVGIPPTWRHRNALVSLPHAMPPVKTDDIQRPPGRRVSRPTVFVPGYRWQGASQNRARRRSRYVVGYLPEPSESIVRSMVPSRRYRTSSPFTVRAARWGSQAEDWSFADFAVGATGPTLDAILPHRNLTRPRAPGNTRGDRPRSSLPIRRRRAPGRCRRTSTPLKDRRSPTWPSSRTPPAAIQRSGSTTSPDTTTTCSTLRRLCSPTRRLLVPHGLI